MSHATHAISTHASSAHSPSARMPARADDVAALESLAREMARELVGNILPFWTERTPDHARGGHWGHVDAQGVADPDAPKGGILHARILWTYSAAHRVLGRDVDRRMADRALAWLRERLVDPVHGGVYWMLAADGTPLDTRKHVYAQAFAIYALAEHHRATGEAASLAEAVALFELVERHAHDAVHGGYAEAFARDWTPLADVRLSAVDADERRSMNTHLHLLEAYAALLRVWPDARLRTRLAELVTLFLDRIVDPGTHHLRLFFDDRWTPRSTGVSFGHDIEASWLLAEAADVLGDSALASRVAAAGVAMADAVLAGGHDAPVGGLFYERHADGTLVSDKEWWPQAEAIVGFVHAWQATGRHEFLDAARATWAFTSHHLVDRVHGEWHRAVSRDGVVRPGHEKVGPWKCPYHDARACLELIERAGLVAEARQVAAA